MEIVCQNNKGFSFIETMVALLVLMIGMLGLFAVQITAFKANKIANMFMVAEDSIHGEIEFIRNMGYVGLTQANLAALIDDGGKTYENYSALGAAYKHASINQACGAPFTYCYFKGMDINRGIDAANITYRYTLKIMVNDQFLPPYLKKARLVIYWEDGTILGRLKKIEVDFMVEI